MFMPRYLCWILYLALLAEGCTTRARAADPVSATHPLEPLGAAEIRSAFELVTARFASDAALPDSDLRFPMMVLREPDKAEVLGFKPGASFARVARVEVLHYPSNRGWVAEVDLRAKSVRSLELLPAGTQLSVASEEYAAAEEIVRAYLPWQLAMEARGLSPELVYLDVWAAGDEPVPADVAGELSHGADTRLLRCLSFDRGGLIDDFDPAAPQNPYDRPIEGVVVTLDMNARKVVAMTDTTMHPVVAETGNAAPSIRMAPLMSVMPAESDIVLDGHLVRWHKWQFYAVLHPREGLVLYDVRFDDGGKLRPIAYRLSLSEIYVPYGLGDENWSWRGAFDVGEYNAGTLAQTLEVYRDVPDTAQFLDALFFSTEGPDEQNPSGSVEYPRSVALYERDAGLLWTRTDPTNLTRDTRFARELVVTWNCWIGNYIYGFDWIFKLDGSIEVRVALTGTTLNRAADAADEPSAPKLGKDAAGVWVSAPNHQHFFSFRLDLDVDGPSNHALQMEVAHVPDTGFKNSFAASMEHLGEEGYRDADPFAARHWHIESAAAKNRVGKPTGYAIEPGNVAVPYSAPDLPALERAAFARHQAWFTRFKEAELYAAGQFPNQAKTQDGLTKFISDSESLAGQDLVLWYTTGFTHVTRPEDFPVMSAEYVSFKLSPRGFFARNPALEVADQVLSQ
jgi:primary-amine oxidase